MIAVAAVPLIHGSGTPGSRWRRWLDDQTFFQAVDDTDRPGATRLTVVAPHPDDEILMAAGWLHRRLARQERCRVIGVTDGDMSHDGCASWTPEALGRIRRQESLAGLRSLAHAAPPHLLDIQRLALPDGGVSAHEAELVARLCGLLTPDDLVITTWRHDGHPDHDATGRATALAARRTGARLLEAPVWMWHWAEPADARVPWTSMRQQSLDPSDVDAKSRALRAHQTQLTPRPVVRSLPREPVLGHEIVQRAGWPREYFFITPTP